MSQTESSAATLAAEAGTNTATEIDAIMASHRAPDDAATPPAPGSAPAPAPGKEPAPATPEAPKTEEQKPAAATDEDKELSALLREYLPRRAPAAPGTAPSPAPGAAPETPEPRAAEAPKAGDPPPPPTTGGKKALTEYVKELREDGYDRTADAFQALIDEMPKSIGADEVRKLVAQELQEREHREQATAYYRGLNNWFDKAVDGNKDLERIYGKGNKLTQEQADARLNTERLTVPMIEALKNARASGNPKAIERAEKQNAATLLRRAMKTYVEDYGVELADPAAPAPKAPASAPAAPRDSSGRFAPNPPTEKELKDMTPTERFQAQQAQQERERASSAREIDAIVAKNARK